jgi:CheY-like chemotaxis protein
VTKILILEDDQTLQTAYKLLLENEGHDVTAVDNGKEGLEVLKNLQPDLILLDLLMPVMDGMTFLRKLRESGDDTKVVVLTNFDQDKHIEEAQELGAYKYIVKANAAPRDLAQLVNHLIQKDIDKKNNS